MTTLTRPTKRGISFVDSTSWIRRTVQTSLTAETDAIITVLEAGLIRSLDSHKPRPRIIEALLANGADPHWVHETDDERKGKTSIDVALEAAPKTIVSMLQKFGGTAVKPKASANAGKKDPAKTPSAGKKVSAKKTPSAKKKPTKKK